MNRTHLIGVLVGMAAVAAAGGPCLGGATAFLSPVTEVGGGAVLGNPGLTVAVGEPITLGLWVSAPLGLTVNGLALDIVDTAGILSAQSLTVQEAGNLIGRWDAVRDPDMNNSPAALFTRGGALGGLGGTVGLAGSAFLRGWDANFDPAVTADGAFLHAVVELMPTAPGDTDLFLRVGCKKIGYEDWEIDTTDDDITFGAADGPVNRRVTGVTGPVADATIHVLPGAGLGDMNGDGNIDNLDTTPFITALVAADEAAFLARFPGGQYWAADCRPDGSIDNLDITPYINIMAGGRAAPQGAGAVNGVAASSQQSETLLGDVSGDGNVDFLDITPFIATVVLGEAAFASWYPDGDFWAADMTGDGNVDGCLDMTPFINAVMGSGDCSTATPEPATLSLLAVGALVAIRRRRRKPKSE